MGQPLLKQPAETLVATLFAGREVAAIEATTSDARGLVSGSAPISASTSIGVAGVAVVATLTGGTDGERYLVTVRAELADGAIREEELEVAVVDATWVMPDGGVAYLTIAEFVENFGLEETVRMTDATGAGRIDRALLVGALRAAQGIANGNISVRYAVPLSTVPDMVKTAIADIARARLYPGGAPDGVAGAAKDALRMLERVASGGLPLPLPTGAAEPAVSDAPVLITPGRRQYPDYLAGY